MYYEDVTTARKSTIFVSKFEHLVILAVGPYYFGSSGLNAHGQTSLGLDGLQWARGCFRETHKYTSKNKPCAHRGLPKAVSGEAKGLGPLIDKSRSALGQLSSW